MTQKKKTDFKIVTPPDDLSEVRAKTKKIHREKLKKIVVPVILIALAVSGTYLMLTNKAYSEAGTAVRYSTDSSDTSNYAHFANGIVRYNRDGVVFLNKKNEEKWIQSTQLKNPIIEVKEKAFAVGDIGGNSILVFSEEGLKGEIETSLPIENMAISDQGIVTVLLKNETAPKIISYDAMGNVLVEQQVTVPVMGYPVAMDMSDDGKMLAVTYFHTDDAVLKRSERERRHRKNIRKFAHNLKQKKKRFLEKGILGKMKNRRKTGLQNMRACLRKKDRI